MKSTMAFHFPSASPTGLTIEQALMAPALTSGVEGWSFSSRMAMMELKGRPVASAPMRFITFWGPYCSMASSAVGTFETDSMPKAQSVSPTVMTSPSGRQAEMPKSSEGTFAR